MDLPSLFMAGYGKSMTSFFSMTYLFIFLPLMLIVYSIVPKKAKKHTLLAGSLAFFWLISGGLVLYLILSIFSVHYFGLWIDRIQTQMKAVLAETEKSQRKAVKQQFVSRQRKVVALAAILHIGLLLVLKYTAFFFGNVNSLMGLLHIPVSINIPAFLMPIGISFFTLQAVSYIVDVYRGVIKADDNLLRLGLFMSFFPQIVEGPICRYQQTAEQLWNVKGITYQNLTMGLQRILYGMMKKVVIADRLNPLVQHIFDKSNSFDGGVIFFGALCYTLQLYMDFSGSMDAVMGTAQIFGVTMPENFERPFFSRTISEFWKRWHITLGAWFRDYIFYPVTTAKRMKNLTSKARKKIGNHYGPLLAGSVALFCVWFCNGLWHGAAWSFIFFGMYHFILILLGNVMEPLVKTVNRKLHINSEWLWYRLLQILRTGILVVFGELFFRANGLRSGLSLFGRIMTNFTLSGFNADLLKKLGIDGKDLLIVGVALILIFVVSLLNEKNISLREALAKRNIVLRWAVLYLLIMFIVIFGAYGFGYIPVDPMYAQF